MVADLALCVLTIVIRWSHKHRETPADFGIQSYAIDYRNKDLKKFEVNRKILKILSNTQFQLKEKSWELKLILTGKLSILDG